MHLFTSSVVCLCGYRSSAVSLAWDGRGIRQLLQAAAVVHVSVMVVPKGANRIL